MICHTISFRFPFKIRTVPLRHSFVKDISVPLVGLLLKIAYRGSTTKHITLCATGLSCGVFQGELSSSHAGQRENQCANLVRPPRQKLAHGAAACAGQSVRMTEGLTSWFVCFRLLNARDSCWFAKNKKS